MTYSQWKTDYTPLKSDGLHLPETWTWNNDLETCRIQEALLQWITSVSFRERSACSYKGDRIAGFEANPDIVCAELASELCEVGISLTK